MCIRDRIPHVQARCLLSTIEDKFHLIAELESGVYAKKMAVYEALVGEEAARELVVLLEGNHGIAFVVGVGVVFVIAFAALR